MILSASSSIIGWQIGCVIILQCVQNCRMHVCNGYRSAGKNYIKVFMKHILLQYISHAFTQNLRPLKVENVTFLREAFYQWIKDMAKELGCQILFETLFRMNSQYSVLVKLYTAHWVIRRRCLEGNSTPLIDIISCT